MQKGTEGSPHSSPQGLAAGKPHLEARGASGALFTSLSSGTLSRREGQGRGQSREKRGRELTMGDTYSRAGGSLSTSFSVFASGTLWAERKELRVVELMGTCEVDATVGQSRCPRAFSWHRRWPAQLSCLGGKETKGKRYLQQRQGVRAHLVLQLCQALPVERRGKG